MTCSYLNSTFCSFSSRRSINLGVIQYATQVGITGTAEQVNLFEIEAVGSNKYLDCFRSDKSL